MLEKMGFTLLAISVVIYFVLIIAALIFAFPVGFIGLIVIGGFALLFAQVVIDRLNNKEDDHYSKNVHQ